MNKLQSIKKLLNKRSLVNFVGKHWELVLITILGLSVAWPLLRGGYFSHQDDLQVIRIFEMRKCFADGQIPCRWVSSMGWGNGYPLFNFYGVFPYYLGAILSYFMGFLAASKLLFLIALVGGSFGMYFLVSELWGKYAGITAAILYLFAPYKALDIYVRGALSESMGLALIPFVFYFFLKLITKPGEKNIFFYSTLTLFFFLITHNIMTVIFLPILIVWIIYWLFATKWKSVKIIVISTLLAIGLSSFFVFPAFFEKELVQTESLTRFELDYRANFISIKQLFFDRAWGYGTSIPGPEGGMSFQVGWPYWLLVGFSAVSLFFSRTIFTSKIRKSTKVLVVGIVGTFIVSVLMTHNKSTFVWESFRILQFFQFPWRFLSLTVFSASILGGFVIFSVKKKWQKIFAIIVIVSTVILNWSYFKPREFFDVTSKQKLTGELWEQQRRGAILDYLPKTALEPREAAPEAPLVISGEASVVDFKNRSNRWEFKAEVSELSEIHIPVYYFPNWEVKVDGKSYPSTHDNLLGRISVTLDKGDYKIEGRFKNTPLRTISNIITIVSIGWFIGLLKRKKEWQ
ncbi:hypothetical protein ISR94_01305 [Candidatus Microgenomates bacterium]|nr:hypothetical protein [Candidatus Microgenomates bacterium]